MFVSLALADVLAEEKDEQMVEFAMGGVCNCCADQLNMKYLLENDCIDFTIKCLSRFARLTLSRLCVVCVCVCACVCVFQF